MFGIAQLTMAFAPERSKRLGAIYDYRKISFRSPRLLGRFRDGFHGKLSRSL